MSGKTAQPSSLGISTMGRPSSAHSQSLRMTSEPKQNLFMEQKHTHKQGEHTLANSGLARHTKKHEFEGLQSKMTATIGNTNTGIFSLATSSNSVRSNHQRTTSGELVSGQGERRVFNFQLDSAFRMDLMKKRMGNKIDLKSETPKFLSNGTQDKPFYSSTFMEGRKPSLDLQTNPEKASSGPTPLISIGRFGELKSNLTTTHNYQTRKTAQDILENMPNKQALIGMIDNQKTVATKNLSHLGANKLQNWKPGTALSDLTDLKSLKTGITMVRNSATNSDWRDEKQIFQTIGGEIKKEPVSIVRAAHIVQKQKSTLEESGFQTNDESHAFLGRSDQNSKGEDLSEPKENPSGPSYLLGGLERVFKKRGSEHDFGRTSGFERKTEEPRVGSRAPRSQSREVHEVKTQNYYMVSLKYNYKKATGGPLALAYKEHFYQTFGALKYLSSKLINPFQYQDIEFAKSKIKPKNASVSGRALASPTANKSSSTA